MNWLQETHDYERGGRQKDFYGVHEVVEVECPFCQSTERERLYTEHANVGVSRCRACQLIYVSPRIRSPEQVYWGPADRYIAEAKLIFEGKACHHRDPNYREELDLIGRFKPEGRFLDVGCNMGFLLHHATERGYKTFGVEPSPTLSEIARAKFGLDVRTGFLQELPTDLDGSFES